MTKNFLTVLILSSSFFIYAASASATETVTVNSFLPSPHANMQTIVLNPHSESTTSGCTAGRIYIDSSGNLQICGDDGAGSTNYSSPSTAWSLSGNNIYTKTSLSTPKVGIGTTGPLERFHLKDGNFLASYQTGTTSENNIFYFDVTNGAMIAGYESSRTLSALSGLGYGSNSTSFGYNALASGRYGFAAGYSTTASGQGAMAIGSSSTASGSASVALGVGATAAGGASLATGGSTANGAYSVSIGYGNTSNGDLSVALGYNNTTNNSLGNATVNADYVLLSPVGAFAVGYGNAASGAGSSAIGYDNSVTGNYSSALGRSITVTGTNSLGIGLGSSDTTFTANNSFGAIGGTTMLTTDATTPAWWLGTIGGTLYVKGKIVSDNSTTLVSDIRMKTNITPIADVLDRIQQLNPIQYHLINPSTDNAGRLIFDAKPENITPEIHSGMSAQEVYKLFPNAVVKPADESKGIWLMSYEDFIPILVEAIKEHKAETDELKTRIEKLEKIIQDAGIGQTK